MFFPTRFIHVCPSSIEQIFSEGISGTNNFRCRYSSTVPLRDFADTRDEQNKVNYMGLESNQSPLHEASEVKTFLTFCSTELLESGSKYPLPETSSLQPELPQPDLTRGNITSSLSLFFASSPLQKHCGSIREGPCMVISTRSELSAWTSVL